ncbi:hypothetical protein [Streptomyces sp.]|uniref:hypothetical protein n=1 Tax=Streptomyces sp. TaxID=1931 RepID=UPI002F957612
MTTDTCKCGHPQGRHARLAGTYAHCIQKNPEAAYGRCGCGMYRPQVAEPAAAPSAPADQTPAETDDERRERYEAEASPWYEVINPRNATTSIALVYNDGSLYLPEGPDALTVEEFHFAAAQGKAYRLILVDEAMSVADTELARERAWRKEMQAAARGQRQRADNYAAEIERLRAKVYEWQGSYLDEVKVRQGRDAVIARVRQMIDAWEQRLPDTISTATAVDAIRHTLEGAETTTAPADRAAVLREAAERFDRYGHDADDRRFGHRVADLLRRMADEAQQAGEGR